jgi:hypothetical protein
VATEVDRDDAMTIGCEFFSGAAPRVPGLAAAVREKNGCLVAGPVVSGDVLA